jgi:hypothetical protein
VIAAISLLGLAITAFWNAKIRMADLRQREFENYHALMRQALGDSGSDLGLADRQALAIFELRRHKEYREITIRVLSRLYEKASNSHEKDMPAVKAITDEISLTLSALNKS